MNSLERSIENLKNKVRKTILYENKDKFIKLVSDVVNYPKAFQEVFESININYLELFVNRLISIDNVFIYNNDKRKNDIIHSFTIVFAFDNEEYKAKKLLYKLIKYVIKVNYDSVYLFLCIDNFGTNTNIINKKFNTQEELLDTITKLYVNYLYENRMDIDDCAVNYGNYKNLESFYELVKDKYKYKIKFTYNNIVAVVYDLKDKDYNLYVGFVECNSNNATTVPNIYMKRPFLQIVNKALKQNDLSLINKDIDKLINFITNNVKVYNEEQHEIVKECIEEINEYKLKKYTYKELIKHIVEDLGINLDIKDIELECIDSGVEQEVDVIAGITEVDNMEIWIEGIKIINKKYLENLEEDYKLINNNIYKSVKEDLLYYLRNTSINDIIANNIDKLKFEYNKFYNKLIISVKYNEINNVGLKHKIKEELDIILSNLEHEDDVIEDRINYIADNLSFYIKDEKTLYDKIYNDFIDMYFSDYSMKDVVENYKDKIDIWDNINNIIMNLKDYLTEIINEDFVNYIGKSFKILEIEQIINKITNNNWYITDILGNIKLKDINSYYENEDIILGFIKSNKDKLNKQKTIKIIKEYEKECLYDNDLSKTIEEIFKRRKYENRINFKEKNNFI